LIGLGLLSHLLGATRLFLLSFCELPKLLVRVRFPPPAPDRDTFRTRPVNVYRLVLKNSIKRALSADFLDGAERAAALSEDELMALIRG